MSSTTFKEPKKGESRTNLSRATSNRRGSSSNAARAAREHWASRDLNAQPLTVNGEGPSTATAEALSAGEALSEVAETSPERTAAAVEHEQRASQDATNHSSTTETGSENVRCSQGGGVEISVEPSRILEEMVENSSTPPQNQQTSSIDGLSAQIQEATGQVARVLPTNDSSRYDPAPVSIDVLLQRIAGQRAGRTQPTTSRQEQQTAGPPPNSRAPAQTPVTTPGQENLDNEDYSTQLPTERARRVSATNDSGSLDPGRTSVGELTQRVSAQRLVLRQREKATAPRSSTSATASGSRPQSSTSASSIAGLSARPPATSAEASTSMSSLAAVVEIEDDECAVCYETISTYSTLHPCGHAFDYICIMEWLETLWQKGPGLNNLTCPLCRTLVFRVQHTYNEARTKHSTLDLETHFRNFRPEQRIRRRWLREFANARPQNDRRGERVAAALPQLANSGSWPGLGRDGQRARSPRLLPGTNAGDYMDDLLFTISRSPEEIQATINSTVARNNRVLEALGEGASTDVDGSQWERIQGGRAIEDDE